MLRKFLTGLAASAVALTAVAPVVAEAQPYYGRGGYEQVRHYRDYDRRYYGGRGYDRGYYGRGYNDRRYYGGRGRCRDKGTGGTIIGAIAGGLLGNEIGNGRYNDRDGTTGAIVGAGVGALAGRAIDRNC
ncbi:YMGG-like glycine zipper-containing protein [Sphingomonas crocodyli]|uniref:Glycine zipper 2TM domain-containing protein n=1 Tax=Sphingomonas crocodyli TaxID=1979270 RepID=A0A437M5N6_9SPHN|nr:YMGG-like glycine zipper-containing protein [Sphingomonas crocodyli]RVT92903.1 glycine zipper 2TM domain-containing protein [Sphingomonas crocodyli]